MIVGIDLGTTNSAVSYMTPEGPFLVPNSLGEYLTPSVVGIDPDGCLLVGRAAKELQITHPERCASVFKRHMGSDWSIDLVGTRFTPEQLSGMVLRALKQDAEVHLGSPVERAVITVPAYFNEHQRRATISAGKIADFRVERIVNEPTAAAVAYGFHESKEERIVVVFDLGGGTFAVSVVETFHGVLEVRASSGDCCLGGEDLTAAVASRILSSRGLVLERTEFELPKLTARLKQQWELAKCRLPSCTEARIRFPDNDGTISEESEEIAIGRDDLCSWSDHILGRCDLPLRRALSDARVKPRDVDAVLLAGGRRDAHARGGRTTRATVRQRAGATIGSGLGRRAGVQAGLIARDEAVEDLVVTDVAPFTLGTAVAKDLGGTLRNGYFCPIIHRNTTIPISRVQRLGTTVPNQTGMEIEVFQGEDRRAEKNLLLGKFMVDGIPKGPPGQAIDIRFTYDLNGMLEVEATIAETKKKVTRVFAQNAHEMSSEEIARAVEEMQSFKEHPREASANFLLLRRAERVYGELPLQQQRRLSDILDEIETALELCERKTIERYQHWLEAFLDQYDIGWGDDDDDNNDHLID